MQAHPSRIVVIYIAAFKVGHSVVMDKDTTALREPREQGQSPMGRWNVTQGLIAVKLTPCHRHTWRLVSTQGGNG